LHWNFTASRSTTRSTAQPPAAGLPPQFRPRGNLLPDAYDLHLPADDVTIWHTVTEHEGQNVINVQHVSLDT
jgi:hypothetical protein